MKNVTILWPSLFATVFLGLDLVLNLPRHNLPIGIWVFLAFVVLQIFVLFMELNKLKSGQPYIVATKVGLEEPFPLKIVDRSTSPEIVTFTDYIIERYYLEVRNEKKKGLQIVDTDPVHAVISFFDNDCNPLDTISHERPFWLGDKPPYERPVDYTRIIRASGKPEGIHLVMRLQGESDFYSFGDNSYDKSRNSLEPFQESLMLPKGLVFICVRLNAKNLDMSPIWISFISRGEKQSPVFKILDASPCKRKRESKH